MNKKVRLGIIGCGRFAEISLQSYKDSPLIEITAFADQNFAIAKELAGKPGFENSMAFRDSTQMFKSMPVDAVHILTPPSNHAAQATAAIEKGIHVFCEKPLAISPWEGEKVLRLATQNGIALSVNYVMRFCPCYLALERIVRDGLFGNPTHFLFENHAQDETLPPGHWFWNENLSGGILVEHGVHFFDIADHLFGKGVVTQAGRVTRPNTRQVDRIWAAVVYNQRMPAFFIHAFDRPDVTERAWGETVFDRGYVSISGWIPTRLSGEAFLSMKEKEKLDEILGPGCAEVLQTYKSELPLRGGGKYHRIDCKVKFVYEPEPDRWKIYHDAIRSGIEDFAGCILQPGRKLKVTGEDALESLQIAHAATKKSL